MCIIWFLIIQKLIYLKEYKQRLNVFLQMKIEALAQLQVETLLVAAGVQIKTLSFKFE